MARIAVIGGTGVYDPSMFSNLEERTVDTPYGTVECTVGEHAGKSTVFLARHGRGHSVPPHRINYRANIWALKRLDVSVILATTAVGSLNPAFKPGDFVMPDQFLDFTKSRISTFFEGGERGVVHVDVTEPYCSITRAHIVRTAEELSKEGTPVSIHNGGVYVCTEGPRFETPAEIAMYRMLGADLVGMTNVPEVVLAAEAEMRYVTISMVTNAAAGMSGEELTHGEVLDMMADMSGRMKALLQRAIETVDENEDAPALHRLAEYGGFSLCGAER